MEFNSDRKRMSVLLRDPSDGLIKLYTKGADSIIKERTNLEEQFGNDVIKGIDEFLHLASIKGFRTLLMGMRVITEAELADFQRECAAAENDILTREVELEKIFDRFERNLVILGATCVEDRL